MLIATSFFFVTGPAAILANRYIMTVGPLTFLFSLQLTTARRTLVCLVFISLLYSVYTPTPPEPSSCFSSPQPPSACV